MSMFMLLKRLFRGPPTRPAPVQVDTGEEWDPPGREPEADEEEVKEPSLSEERVVRDRLREACCDILQGMTGSVTGYTITLQSFRAVHRRAASPFTHPLMENCSEEWFKATAARFELLGALHGTPSVSRGQPGKYLEEWSDQLPLEELFFFRLCAVFLDTDLWPGSPTVRVRKTEQGTERFRVCDTILGMPSNKEIALLARQDEAMSMELGEGWWHSCADTAFWPDCLLGSAFTDVITLMRLIVGEEDATKFSTAVFALADRYVSGEATDDCIIL